MVGRGVERRGRPASHPLGRGQPVGIDVVEDDVGVAQRRRRQDVAEQVLGEHDASGADEDDPRHAYLEVGGPQDDPGRPDVRTSVCLTIQG